MIGLQTGNLRAPKGERNCVPKPFSRLPTALSLGRLRASAHRHSVFDEDHRAGHLDLQHDVAAHRRQRQYRFAGGPSTYHLPVTLHGPSASGVIDWDLPHLLCAAQHCASPARPAGDDRPARDVLGRRLRA